MIAEHIRDMAVLVKVQLVQLLKCYNSLSQESLSFKYYSYGKNIDKSN